MRKTNVLPHLATRVLETPLLIDPNKLAVLLGALGPRIGLSETLHVDGLGTIRVMQDDEMDEDEMPMEDENENAKPYHVTPSGVAVIQVCGTLVKDAGWLGALSGLTSYSSIRAKFMDACNDDRIKSIVMSYDSPGGEVSGLFDLVDDMYKCRDKKPCIAVADDCAYSAAYALYSAASHCFVSRTSGLGSIGVIAVHCDRSAMDEKLGLKYTAIYAGDHKNDMNPHEPLSNSGRETLTAEVDRLYGMFVDTVARNRGMNAKAVRGTEAGCYFGGRSLEVGLADTMGTLFDAVSFAEMVGSSSVTVAVHAAAENVQFEARREEMPPENIDAVAEPVAQTPTTLAIGGNGYTNGTVVSTDTVTVVGAAPLIDAVNAPAAIQETQDEIIAVCEAAHEPMFALEAIKSRMSVADVRKALLDRKVAAESAVRTNSVGTQSLPASAAATLDNKAKAYAAEHNVTLAQAYAKVLDAQSYGAYLKEKAATLSS